MTPPEPVEPEQSHAADDAEDVKVDAEVVLPEAVAAA